jgi:putative ABC transport system ATP-binding protein
MAPSLPHTQVGTHSSFCEAKKSREAFVSLLHLYKGYPEGGSYHPVIRDLSLEIYKGEIVAILGRSGSGKTTLLNIISGIDYPDKGDIYIASHHLSHLRENERTAFRRQYIGFVFQFFNLITTLTVWENLTLPLVLNRMTSKDDFRRAEDLLERVGLADRRNAFPDQLSGGEQQRVAIARSLVHQPLLVLADEPTGNLDEENGQMVLSLLEQLTRDRGNTLILVTHNRDAAFLADRLFSLKEGKVVELNNGRRAATTD